MLTDPPPDPADAPLPSPASIVTDPPGPDDPDPLRMTTDPPAAPDPPTNIASPPMPPLTPPIPTPTPTPTPSPERSVTLAPGCPDPLEPADTEIDPARPDSLSPVPIDTEPDDAPADAAPDSMLIPLPTVDSKFGRVDNVTPEAPDSLISPPNSFDGPDDNETLPAK